MLIDVDYAYSIRQWGEGKFDVEDPKDFIEIESYIRDELEQDFGNGAVITDIVIDRVREVTLNV